MGKPDFWQCCFCRVTVKAAGSYQKKELTAKRGKKQIYGVVYIPQGNKKCMPTVIYSHGFGGSYESGENYAKALAKEGYVVYCFDFCGGSEDSRSDGSALDMSVFTDQKDLEAVIKMLKKQAFVDKNNIFLLGSSQGGFVSAITAADHADGIRGMILLYPAFVLVDDAKGQFDSVSEISDQMFYKWMTVGKAYFKDILDYDVYSQIKKYKKRVLIIHGDADDIVPLSYSKKVVSVYKKADLKVIKGAGHVFYGKEERSAKNYMLDYLADQVNRR